MLLNELLGRYLPGYFDIYINTNNFLDLNKLSEKELSTFFHEWIHFIQDFTTGVGCNNAYVQIELLKYLAKESKKMSVPVSVPVRLGTDMNVAANLFIRKEESGIGPENCRFGSVTGVENKLADIPQAYLSDGSLKVIPITEVTTDAGEKFQFGTVAIMESMAHLCQAYLFPINPGDYLSYPYHVAEMVVEYFCPEIKKNPLNIVALCDMALMSSAPGAQFTSYLMGIRDCTIPKPSKPEDIYDWFYGRTLMKGYTAINDMACRSYLGILRDPVSFKDFRRWIQNVYSEALRLRQSDRYFLLDLLRGGELSKNKSFHTLLELFGSPLMHNNVYDYGKIPLSGNTGWDVEYMQAIKQILLILCGACGCELEQWCTNSEKTAKSKGMPEDLLIHPDKRCSSNPPSRCNDERLCPLALVWYAANLPQIRV